MTQLTEAMELFDLLLRLAESRRRGKGLSYWLSLYFASQAIEGTMTRVVGLVAVASWFAAPPTGAGNRPGTHIAESTDLELGLSTLGFQRGERIGHRNASSFLAYYYSRIKATK
jgi:hypothetical protein